MTMTKLEELKAAREAVCEAAEDAYLIKTDNLSISQAFEKVMEIIRGKG